MNVRERANNLLLNNAANRDEAINIIRLSASWEDWKIEKMAMKPVSASIWKQYWSYICQEYNACVSSSSARTLTGSPSLPVYQKPLSERVKDSLAIMGDLD